MLPAGKHVLISGMIDEQLTRMQNKVWLYPLRKVQKSGRAEAGCFFTQFPLLQTQPKDEQQVV